MVYGWGKKSKDWVMPDGRTLVCGYSYVSLMFVFKFVWSRKWHLIGRDRAMDVQTDRAELERIYGQGNVPDIGVFERFGMFITGGVIVAVALGSFAVQSVLGVGSDDSATEAGLDEVPVAEVIGSDEGDGTEGDGTNDDGNVTSAGDSEGDADDAGIPADGGADDDGDLDLARSDDSDLDLAPSADSVDSSASYQVAEVPEPTDGQRLASTNPGRPTKGWSELTVHNIHATSEQQDAPGSTPLEADEKMVVVEYQLLQVDQAVSMTSGTFRLKADGVTYSSVESTNYRLLSVGEVHNSSVRFVVPVEQDVFRFEAGVPDPSGDGYQSSYDFTLTDGQAPPAPERFSGPDQTGSFVMTSAGNLFSGSRGQTQNPITLEVLGAIATSKVGPDAAPPGFKYVVVDVAVVAQEGYGSFTGAVFRMEAENELYPGLGDDLYQTLSAGEAWSGPVLFLVPISATTVAFEAGVPEGWDEGERIVSEITFG